MDTLIQQIINGLVLGSIYALVALGYTMVYGILGLINFAHGEVVMVGAPDRAVDRQSPCGNRIARTRGRPYWPDGRGAGLHGPWICRSNALHIVRCATRRASHR
jgi:hypothetical protein